MNSPFPVGQSHYYCYEEGQLSCSGIIGWGFGLRGGIGSEKS